MQSFVLCQSRLLLPADGWQVFEMKHQILYNAGVISASWGIFKFLKIMLNQFTPVQEVLFFPKNGMRFIINLGYINEKINAFGQVVVHFKEKKKDIGLLFNINH